MPLRRVENVYPANRPIRIAYDRVDKPHETLLVIGEILRAVERGIGIEIDPQAFAIAAVVDEYGKVVGRAIGQVVRRRGIAGEAEIVVERLDVDDGCKKVLVRRQQIEVPPQVLISVGLVPNRLADFPSHLTNERCRAHARLHGQTQRHGVRNHAGNTAQASLGPGRNRQTDDQIFNTCHAIEISRDRGDHDLRETCAADLRCSAQHLHAFSRKMARLTAKTADILPSLIGETERGRPIGEVLQPILAVAYKSFGASIRGFFFKEELQGTERALFGRASLSERGVDLGDAPGEEPAREPVHDDVMAAMVPEIVVRRGLEQCAGPKRPCQQIDRSSQLCHHPAFCGRPRIRLGTDIDERKGRIQYGRNDLSRPIALLDEPYAHGFRFDPGLPQGQLE